MKRAVRRALLISALAAPSALYGLGLGEIRLNSALNQPFDAEIELVSATPDDLAALRASLASGETFQRYGLDKPAYLADFTFRVARSGGRDVLRVSSPRAVTEPFVTLLVEASWPRGRLLREYTVLLDPPVYTAAPTVSAAPAAAPRASAPPVMAAPPVPRTTAAPAVSNSAMAATPVPRMPVEPGSTYHVRPNDTLYRIASAANPGPRAEVNRTMVAIYEANPSAFGGNINVLRAGSDLRIPTSSDVAAIPAAAAADEVARQYRLWTSGSAEGTAAASEAPGRLRLVTPEQGTSAQAPTTATTQGAETAAASTAELEDRLQRLEAELAETRRLLEVRNSELATLQGSAAAAEPGAVPEAIVPSGEMPEAAPGESEPQQPAAEAKAEPEAVAPPPKPAAKPKPVPPPEPSLFDRIREYWWALLLLLVAALGIGAWLRRRRESSESSESLEEALGRRATDLSGRATVARSPEPDIVVEEKPAAAGLVTAGTIVPPSAAPEPTRRPVAVDDTLSGDAAVSIETSDPLAEADFHMAYGLYDQAADLVQLAAKREPKRRDLKLKLVEIYFVWGNRDRFLEVAREMHATRSAAEAGEWDKILIMGRQLAPEDPLFKGAASTAAGSLDLELHGGTVATDFELPHGESPRPDLDLTMRSPEVRRDDGIDFLLDEPVRGGAEEESALAPTVESPRPRGFVDEPTAEVPIEDLGLDTSALDELSRVEKTLEVSRSDVEDTVQEPVLDPSATIAESSGDDLLSATSLLRTGVGELSRLETTATDTPVLDLSETTGELLVLDSDDIEPTGEVPRLGAHSDADSTLSEVGTKLDLARAYVDMGDPEGARSILEEVLKEGNAAHKQEAERLMAGLP